MSHVINGISFPFTVVSNSRQWPSSDPSNRPTTTITCELCEWTQEMVTYGQFSTGEDPWAALERTIVFHSDRCPRRPLDSP